MYARIDYTISPTAPKKNALYLDTETQSFKLFDGSVWRGINADKLDGIDSTQFQRNDTADLNIGVYASAGDGAKRVTRYIGLITDTKPGLVLFAKKYDGSNYLPKQGFIGKVIISRGYAAAYNYTEEYNVVCASAYASTKLFISGNYSNAYLVEVTYNNEQWYGFYSPAKSSRAVWIDGFLYTTQDPIFIADASSYTVTKVDGNDFYVNQNVVWNNGNTPVSKATNGYQKLPSGLIIQWGYGYVSATSTATITFPIAFPNACLNVVATDVNAQYEYNTDVGSLTTTTFTALNGNSNSTYAHNFYWIAIGY